MQACIGSRAGDPDRPGQRDGRLALVMPSGTKAGPAGFEAELDMGVAAIQCSKTSSTASRL